MGNDNKNSINVSSWIENQIKLTMKEIENNKDDESLLSILDKYISMKKKYEGSIDHLGEIVRVMEQFALFIQKNYPENSDIPVIVNHFLNSR